MNEEQQKVTAGDSVQPVSAEGTIKPNDVKFEGLRCSTCRVVKTDDQLMKQPLDYKKNSDGSVTPIRYSIFCSTCQMFLCIYDPLAAEELKDIIDTRNQLEARKPE